MCCLKLLIKKPLAQLFMATNAIIAYIGLGSNLNQPKAQIKQALMQLEQHIDIQITALSNLYQSKPLLDMPQPDYINAVVQIKTKLTPSVLLTTCQQIEHKQHRIQEKKWGARTIDLDILLYGNQTITTENLSIPHPQIAHRAFVLLPLCDIDPSLIIPKNKRLSDMIKHIDTSQIHNAN